MKISFSRTPEEHCIIMFTQVSPCLSSKKENWLQALEWQMKNLTKYCLGRMGWNQSTPAGATGCEWRVSRHGLTTAGSWENRKIFDSVIKFYILVWSKEMWHCEIIVPLSLWLTYSLLTEWKMRRRPTTDYILVSPRWPFCFKHWRLIPWWERTTWWWETLTCLHVHLCLAARLRT